MLIEVHEGKCRLGDLNTRPHHYEKWGLFHNHYVTGLMNGTTGDYTGMANFGDPDKPVLETFNGSVQGVLDLGDARKFALQSVTVDDVPATASYMDYVGASCNDF